MRIIFQQPTVKTQFDLLKEFGFTSEVISNHSALAILTSFPGITVFNTFNRFKEGALVELLRHKSHDKDETVLELRNYSNYYSFVIYVYEFDFKNYEEVARLSSVKTMFSGLNSETNYCTVAGTVERRYLVDLIGGLNKLNIDLGNLDHIEY